MLRQWPSLPASLARMIYVRHPQHTATNGGRAPACTPRTRCSSRRPGIACNRDNDEMLAPRQPPQRASTRRQPPRATLHDDCPLCTSERLSKGGAMPSGSLHQLDDVRGPQGVARRQPHAHQLHLLVLIIDTSGSNLRPHGCGVRGSTVDRAHALRHGLRDGCRLLVHRALVRHHATAAAHARQ